MTRASLNGLAALTLMAGLWVFFAVSPLYTDDMRFALPFADYITGNNGGSGFPWEKIGESISERRTIDNARIGNLAVMPFLAMPRWIGASVSALFWWLAMYGAFRMAGIRMRRSTLLPLGTLLWLVCMVWTDGMDGLVFQFNYIIPSSLGIWLLLMLRRRQHGLGLALTALLALLLGLWQEAIACPVAVMVSAMYLCGGAWRQKASSAAVGLLVAGMCYLTWHYLFIVTRLVDADGGFGTRILHAFAYHRGFLLLLLLTCIAIRKYGLRGLWRMDVPVLMLTGSLTAMAVAVLTTGSARSGWWMDFCGVCGSLWLLRKMIPASWPADYRGPRILWWILPVTAMLAVMIPADMIMIRNAQSYREAIAEHRRNPDRLVYADYITPDRIPLVAWPLVSTGLYRCQMEMNAIDRFHFPEERLRPGYVKFLMIPSGLRSIPLPQQLIASPSGSSAPQESSIGIYRGRLLGIVNDPELREGSIWQEKIQIGGRFLDCYAIALRPLAPYGPASPASCSPDPVSSSVSSSSLADSSGSFLVWYAIKGRRRLPAP